MDLIGHTRALADLAAKQLFFVGGAPRSGTTWLQQMLDAHPDCSCRGEGLFWAQLATPLDALMEARGTALDKKNTELFGHTGGYPLPDPADTETLLGLAILQALHRQCVGRNVRAIGEKTPENVFFFTRLKTLFPTAKFIGIARDPRDVLASAWHMFQPNAAPAGQLDFVRSAIPSLDHGARVMLELARDYPDDCRIVTYETLHQAPLPALTVLFALLGLRNDPALVGDCLERTSFAVQTRTRGAQRFLRKGVMGDWRETLTSDSAGLIVRDLGWMFAEFGWQ